MITQDKKNYDKTISIALGVLGVIEFGSNFTGYSEEVGGFLFLMAVFMWFRKKDAAETSELVEKIKENISNKLGSDEKIITQLHCVQGHGFASESGSKGILIVTNQRVEFQVYGLVKDGRTKASNDSTYNFTLKFNEIKSVKSGRALGFGIKKIHIKTDNKTWKLFCPSESPEQAVDAIEKIISISN